MNAHEKFHCSNRGVVTVEFALILPVLLTIAYFSVDVVRIMRTENRLHRVTAILADAIANQHLDKGTELSSVIGNNTSAYLRMLDEMLGEGGGGTGVVVTYLDTTTLNAPSPLLLVYNAGSGFENTGAPDLVALGKSGLISDVNVAQAEVVMVECVYDMPKDMFLSNMVYPEKFTSYFITLRKQWR